MNTLVIGVGVIIVLALIFGAAQYANAPTATAGKATTIALPSNPSTTPTIFRTNGKSYPSLEEVPGFPVIEKWSVVEWFSQHGQ